jgi:hypothetical protein
MKVDGKRGQKGIFKKKEVKERKFRKFRKFFTILQLIFTITILFDLV